MKKLLANNKGIVMSDMIIALIIASSLIPILINCLLIYKNYLKPDSDSQDTIALYQLRRTLALSTITSISEDALYYEYHNEEFFLDFVNNNLIIKPGTQFVLTAIDDYEFYELNNEIWIAYERDNKTQNYLLCIY